MSICVDDSWFVLICFGGIALCEETSLCRESGSWRTEKRFSVGTFTRSRSWSVNFGSGSSIFLVSWSVDFGFGSSVYLHFWSSSKVWSGSKGCDFELSAGFCHRAPTCSLRNATSFSSSLSFLAKLAFSSVSFPFAFGVTDSPLGVS